MTRKLQQRRTRRPTRKTSTKNSNKVPQIIGGPVNSTRKGTSLALFKDTQHYVVQIPRNLLSPDCVIVTLSYTDITNVRTNIGNSFASWRLRMNSAFDPDPGFLTGAIPGFTEWSAFYDTYRVVEYSYDIQIGNREAFPMTIVACPTIVDAGLNASVIQSFFASPYSTESYIGAMTGNDHARLRGYIDIGEFHGNAAQFIADDAYQAPVTGNPTTMHFMNFGVIAGSGSTLTAGGVLIRSNSTYTVVLHNRKTLTL